ncbi:hypothetical protein GCM10011581_38780 [Saccharopolyspora subtropica]|uniref:Uncharacterized protein n=1 Tax=Saccharopolyspora thermophila TaxID=89367 RepID=A0A917NG30_9PSEU|nr:type I-E CRISPR-associated endoribonuclease Cas2 [Saccharopolyspora subtropica]GGI97871.1 hypothetical protein GCM10011581_38780 [Saccharopolyspora subtropica]
MSPRAVPACSPAGCSSAATCVATSARRGYGCGTTSPADVYIHPDNNEQRYTIKTAGRRRRHIIDHDGLQLIAYTPEPTTQDHQNEQLPF